MKRLLKKRGGQSTLEYVIVLTAIIAAILFAAAVFIKPSLNRIFRDSFNAVNASGNLMRNKIGGGVL